MSMKRSPVLVALMQVVCAALFAATPAWGAITLVNNPNPYTPLANPPSDPEVVTLLDISETGPYSVNFQNLLNAFDNGNYSGTGLHAGNGRSINFNPTPLNGTLTIDEYEALSGGEDRGVAHLKAHYTPGAGDPALANLNFIQMVTTNYPGGTSASTPQGQRIDGGPGPFPSSPFYPYPTAKRVNGDLLFTDYPARNCRPPHPPGADTINWAATLLLSSYDGTTLNVYTGVFWGWKMVCPVVPGAAAPIQRASASLTEPGGIYVAAGNLPAQYTVTPLLLPTAQIDLANVSLEDILSVGMIQDGPNQIYTFNTTLKADVSANGEVPTQVLLTGQFQMEVFDRIGEVEGEFATEMLSMQLTGSSVLPGYGPVSLTLRESPTLSSTGTLEDVGTLAIDAAEFFPTAGEAPFLVSSFFDVFTELSIDGGAFAPNLGGAMRVELAVAIPEPGTAAMLMVGGVMLLRRRVRG